MLLAGILVAKLPAFLAYAKSKFSHDAAQMMLLISKNENVFYVSLYIESTK